MKDLTEDSFVEALRSTLAINRPIAFRPTHIYVEEYGPHCVTITHGLVRYRFFGRGVWRAQNIPIGGKWWAVNAVRVPTDVLCTAAKCCKPLAPGPAVVYDNGRSGKRAGRKA